MSDRNLSLDDATIDDLPRTLRRHREARERARQDAPDTPTHSERNATTPPTQWDMPSEPIPAIVRAIDVPFFRLVLFFLKAVVAAIPALILLTAILFAGGQVLKHYFPNLRHFEIEIRPIGSALDPVPAPASAVRPATSTRK